MCELCIGVCSSACEACFGGGGGEHVVPANWCLPAAQKHTGESSTCASNCAQQPTCAQPPTPPPLRKPQLAGGGLLRHRHRRVVSYQECLGSWRCCAAPGMQLRHSQTIVTQPSSRQRRSQQAARHAAPAWPDPHTRLLPAPLPLHLAPSPRFIHLPLFNVLLGWPIQFLGLVVTP